MNEVTRARVQLFAVLLIIIIAAHILLIKLFVFNHPEAEPAKEPAVEASAAATASTAPVQAAAAQPAAKPEASEEKPGFWSRLFGFSRKPAAQPVAKTPEPPPPPVYRYKKPTGNPKFGQPFNFATAVRGDLPANVVPGSAGARTGIMVDLNTRNVLWEKDSFKMVPVASMVKMMTLLLTFEEMERNPAISLDTPVKITRTVLKVPRTGIIWLDPRETFPLSDLLKAVTIKSANDAATQVAEFIGGDVNSFIIRMNQRARSLGMMHSKFVSPCGLKDKKLGNSLSCARDMVVVGEQLLEYPPVMQWSTTKQDSIREGDKKTILTTTNKLVNPRWPGVDGLKTGYTADAGSCLTFSVLRDGRRILGCVTGFKSARDRDRFCRKLIDWGYRRAATL